MPFFKTFFNYLPGLVVLVLAMLALYAAVGLFDAYEAEGIRNDHRVMLENRLYWAVIAIGLAGFVLTVVHASKLSELKILHEEKRLALQDFQGRLAALEMARDGILILDEASHVIFLNRSLCLILGVDEGSKDGLVGQHWSNLFSVDDYEVIDEDIVPELEGCGFWIGEFPIYGADGTVVYTEMSLTQVPDVGLVATLQDISYRQKAEDEKKILQDQFYQAQKMEAIGRLAGGIAHDFNNILASMNGYAEFLIDDVDQESPQHGFAKNIVLAGMQARCLVDKMLSFSRIDSKEFESMDVVAAAEETLSMLRATLSKSIDLRYDCDVVSAHIHGNSTQISQLLMNLCVNAQDAMDENGRLSVSVEVLTSGDATLAFDPSVVKDHLPSPEDIPLVSMSESGERACHLILGHVVSDQAYVKICVEDSGSGMSRSIMEHIFEPFFTTKPVDKGTGLGLATSHNLVASHQGCMVINSALMQGTVFELYFPLLDFEVVAVPEFEDNVIDLDIEARKKLRILLVEDQEDVRVMTLQMLSRIGYDAISAVSGRDGLEVVREDLGRFDLVITDHNMPEMTGLEMIECLHREFPDLPFIMLSGYSEEKIKGIIDNHPAILHVLKKPVSKQALSEYVDGIFFKVA